MDDERMNPSDFWLWGQRSRAYTLCIRPCGHNTDYSFCLLTLKPHMYIVHDERRNPINLGSQGRISRSILAPCEERPRFALSS